jgi:hypothetical protein
MSLPARRWVLPCACVLSALLAPATTRELLAAAGGAELKDTLKSIERALKKRDFPAVVEGARKIAAAADEESAAALFDLGLRVESSAAFREIVALLSGMQGEGPMAFFAREGEAGKRSERGVFLAEILA